MNDDKLKDILRIARDYGFCIVPDDNKVLAINHHTVGGSFSQKLGYLEIDPVSFFSSLQVLGTVSSCLEKKKEVFIHSLPRSGGNHLHATLHYHPEVFCLSERVDPRNNSAQDVFGKFSPITFYKMISSKCLVWKVTGVRDPSLIIYFDKVCKDHVSIFNFRHPYLVFLSAKREELKGNSSYHWLKESWSNRPNLLSIVCDYFKNIKQSHLINPDRKITYQEICAAQALQLSYISYAINRGITSTIAFHEELLANKDKMESIYNTLGLACDSQVYSFKAFISDMQEKNSDDYDISDGLMGFGGYNPERKILLKDEINILNENRHDAEMMIDLVCEFSKKNNVDEEVIFKFREFYLEKINNLEQR